MNILFDIAPLLVADSHHGASLEARQQSDEGGVVGVCSISVNFKEVFEHQRGQIQKIGPIGMTGDLGSLPGGEVFENVALEMLDFSLELPQFLLVGAAIPTAEPELLELMFQLDYRFLKIQGVFVQ
jgi:hypothetical protein